MFAHDAAVEKGPMYVLLLVCSVIEICTGVPKVFQLLNDPDAVPPGDFKFDPLGFGGGKELEARAAAFVAVSTAHCRRRPSALAHEASCRPQRWSRRACAGEVACQWPACDDGVLWDRHSVSTHRRRLAVHLQRRGRHGAAARFDLNAWFRQLKSYCQSACHTSRLDHGQVLASVGCGTRSGAGACNTHVRASPMPQERDTPQVSKHGATGVWAAQ